MKQFSGSVALINGRPLTMAEEGNGSNGFIIIAIIVGIIAIASISIANLSTLVTKILYWILGITIAIVVLV